MRSNDILSGLVLIVAASVMIWLTIGFPPFPGQDYGPALFPRILGAGLILCGLLLVARGIARHRAGERWITLQPWTRDIGRLGSFLLIPTLIVLYILFSERVGFLIIAFLMLTILLLWFRARAVVALPVAVIATWSIHWFFGTLMRVPLPRGILTDYL